MRNPILAVSVLLPGLLAPAVPALAHDVAAPNGGQVTDAGAYHIEMVARDRAIEVFVADHAGKPVPVTGFKGVAILMAGGKPARVPLAPSGGKLSGTAEVALPAHPKGAVQLTAPDGSSASGQFK